MSLGWRGQKEFDDHFAFFDKMFRTLKKQGKINPDYKNLRKQSEILIKYSDSCRYGFNKLDSITRDTVTFQNYLNTAKTFGFDERAIMMNYTSFLMYLILLSYSNMENMLLIILKGAKYGKNNSEQITGSETLTQLFKKIEKLYPQEPLPYDVIDTKFRNAIAHGWYFISHDSMTYFEDALMSQKKDLSVAKLFRKHMRLNIMVMAITHLVLAMDY